MLFLWGGRQGEDTIYTFLVGELALILYEAKCVFALLKRSLRVNNAGLSEESVSVVQAFLVFRSGGKRIVVNEFVFFFFRIVLFLKAFLCL